jgi:hypothetical protein
MEKDITREINRINPTLRTTNELARVRTGVKMSIGSIQGILTNLNGNDLLYKSFAIIASNASSAYLMKLINYMQSKNIISNIHYTKIKEICDSICVVAFIHDFPLR